MESFKIENLTFTYPNQSIPALDNISLSVNKGEFITICGKSGCGKSTFLRHLKPSLKPHGVLSGTIYFENTDLNTIELKEECQKIGFVLQNPENQIVTDKVWHELAFGLENLGFSNTDIRSRVAEMASFFGINDWFYKNTAELSGGQKQLLNLASVMVMHPSVLILDEPTSQLDPICAKEFLETLSKLNRETGITVILSEHHLEDAFPISDRVIVMDNGKIISDETPENTGKKLSDLKSDMTKALPTPVKVFNALKKDGICPVTVRDGRLFLESISGEIKKFTDFNFENQLKKEPVITVKDVWFRYEKNENDVLKNFSLEINKGEFYAIVGGNGAGKTTALSVISSILKPYRGNVKTTGKVIMLPQNPKTLFVKKSIIEDFYDVLSDINISQYEKDVLIKNAVNLCQLDGLTLKHPYDLSGGEIQRAALAKILLTTPDIILLDEPTKGIDAVFKENFGEILLNLKNNGITLVMVSHDIEFCALYADRCALFFDGGITSEDTPRNFFSGKSFYTTAANRMARSVIPNAITPDDIIYSFKDKEDKTYSEKVLTEEILTNFNTEKEKVKRLTNKNIIFGSLFLLLFIITYFTFDGKFTDYRNIIYQVSSIVLLYSSLINFLPKKEVIYKNNKKNKAKLSKRSAITFLITIILVCATIFWGMYALDDKKYYLISLLIIFETILPFLLAFESRKPKAKELVIISVMCAIAVAGRTILSSFPQFKPALAIVIISGVCFGGETGFLVGCITGFVSNFFFGQGPWTPWQMFAYGVSGFIAGVIFRNSKISLGKINLCIYGFISAIVIFGGIVNPSSVLMWYDTPTFKLILASYAAGVVFDAVHGIATAFFLYFIAEPMIEKLDRIKTKYDIFN